MNWKVEISEVETAVNTLPPLAEPITDWLQKQTQSYEWLLAHTYDGVIWGRLDGTDWQLSSSLNPNAAQLTNDTLLELRLFGESGECYLWRDGTTFNVRTISDGSGNKHDYYDEPYLLWGTSGQDAGNGFTTLSDGSQGLQHVVPIALTFAEGNGRPASLTVRHYVSRDKKTGLARVVMSRLQAVNPSEEVKNGTQA